MNILLCPDSFKGSLMNWEVCDAMRRGFLRAGSDFHVVEKPLSDGGEGTVAALIRGTGGKEIQKEVSGPFGEKVTATIGILPDDKTAIIEMAQACGLFLVPPEKRNPRWVTTYGVGELIQEALLRGYQRIILGIGGSASTDAGMGALQALGIHFYDDDGHELPGIGESLRKITHIDTSHIFSLLSQSELLIACDVNNPLYGPKGAAYIFSPQKGATPEDVLQLDEGLRHFAWITQRVTGKNINSLPGAGAAGGIGAGLFAYAGAQMVSGINIIIELLNLEEEIAHADLVVSGEGKVDNQTLYGKVLSGVIKLCRKYHRPLLIFAGTIDCDASEAFAKEAALFSIVNGPISENEAMEKAKILVENSAFHVAHLLKMMFSAMKK